MIVKKESDGTYTVLDGDIVILDKMTEFGARTLCDKLNAQSNKNNEVEEIKEEVSEILGLETSPNGERYFFLIRDEKGTIVEGIPFEEEVTEIVELITKAKEDARAERDREIIKIFDRFSEIYNWHKDGCTGNLHKPDCPSVLFRKKVFTQDKQ